jgi:hypothetical protein
MSKLRLEEPLGGLSRGEAAPKEDLRNDGRQLQISGQLLAADGFGLF